MTGTNQTFRTSLLVAGLSMWALTGCGREDQTVESCQIAVANGYLASIVADLCGAQEPLFNLAPPGMCPAHFDISPAQVRQLRSCKILLVFDFQRNIETGLKGFVERGLTVAPVEAPKGLCQPASYLQAARQTAALLTNQFPQRAAGIAGRLETLVGRTSQLETELKNRVEQGRLTGVSVVASSHQALFAGWLGLTVTGTFSGTDQETAAGLNGSLQQAAAAPVRVIIANRPEGTALAKAIAQRLDAPVAVFDNFPATAAPGLSSFETMLHNNITQLLQAAGQ